MPLRAACRGGLARSDEWQGPCLVASCVKAGPSRRDSSPCDGRTPLMPPGSTRPRNSQAQLEDLESNDHDEPQLLGSRLLSPEQAAAYLGLRSRFAIYRLVASGRLRALRLANKLRLDLQDLDSMIEDSKVESTGNVDRSQSVPAAARAVPRELGPNRRRR